MVTLKKPLHEISLYARETRNGKTVKNKCGRDFLYYCLNYHYPDVFNDNATNPLEIEKRKYFGVSVPFYLAWTQVQFVKVSSFFKSYQLELSINGVVINNFFDFVRTILFSRKEYHEAMELLQKAIDNNETVGVDFSLRWGGLLDHVVFVYGYDESNFYVIDTHTVSDLEYKEVSSCLFLLPREVLRKRWTKFGRVWRVFRQ